MPAPEQPSVSSPFTSWPVTSGLPTPIAEDEQPRGPLIPKELSAGVETQDQRYLGEYVRCRRRGRDYGRRYDVRFCRLACPRIDEVMELSVAPPPGAADRC